MAIDSNLEGYFRPEVRKAGEDLYKKDLVTIRRAGSDTRLDAYIKASPPIKVSFSSDSVSAPVFTANCSCSAAKKGQLCKHIWATLLVASNNVTDFLESKIEISKKSEPMNSSLVGQELEESGKTNSKPAHRFRNQKSEEFRLRQTEFRKRAYQNQKDRAKLYKAKLKTSKRQEDLEPKSDYSSEVQQSLDYFSFNGFALNLPLTEESLKLAKRALAKVFHPDKGGSHKEMTELLGHAQNILEEIARK